MTYEIVNKILRPWGYEIRLKVLDDKEIKGVVEVLFPKKPTDKFLNRKCQSRVGQFEQQLLISPEVLPVTYTADEVTQLLRNKGYLQINEAFANDMPLIEDRPALPVEVLIPIEKVP